MVRLLLVWLAFTVLLFGYRYFVDKAHKQETRTWGIRFLVQGLIVAIVLALIVFLERL